MERMDAGAIGGACPTKSGRGRPPDPRLIALDLELIQIAEQLRPIGIRGCFYQCVSRTILDKIEKNVQLVQRRLLILRRTGRVPYSYISDPASDPIWYRSYNSVQDFAQDVNNLYRSNYWRIAESWPIIVVEKLGLVGVLAPVTEKWGVPLFSCGGQQSETLIYRIGYLIARRGKPCNVWVLSDFDAAGDCIYETFRWGSKDAPGGIYRFTENVPVSVNRLALTVEQIEYWALPTRPANIKDKRSKKFIDKYGDRAVELDALAPDTLRSLVDQAIAWDMPPETLAQFQTIEEEERWWIKNSLIGDH
jgi:hypothetical protein